MAIRDLVMAGRVMKGQKLLARLQDRYTLASLAGQLAGDDALPVLPEWLLARLTELGLESGDDMALLDAEDLLPEEPPEEIAANIERRFPTRLNIGDAAYEIEYQVSKRTAILHQVRGRRKLPPSPVHLPRLPGFKLFWEYKNRVLPIQGRR